MWALLSYIWALCYLYYYMAKIIEGVIGKIRGNIGGLNFARSRKTSYIKRAVFQKTKTLSYKQEQVIKKFIFIRKLIVPFTKSLNEIYNLLNGKVGGQQFFLKHNYYKIIPLEPSGFYINWQDVIFYEGGYNVDFKMQLLYDNTFERAVFGTFDLNLYNIYFKGDNSFFLLLYNEGLNEVIFIKDLQVDFLGKFFFSLPVRWVGFYILNVFVFMRSSDNKIYATVQYGNLLIY